MEEELNKNVTADEEVKQEETVTETAETVEETVAEEAKEEEIAEEPDKETEKESEEAEKSIASLNDEIARLKGELETATTSVSANQNELSTATTTVEAQKAIIADYETILSEIVTSKLADIPDTIKALMPEKATITEKLAWINKAEQSGILKATENPNVEIGKPLKGGMKP